MLAKPGTSLLGQSPSRTFTLGPVLGDGGEGTVFSIAGRQDCVIKIYRRTPDAKLKAKIDALISLRSRKLAAFSAWPEEAVFLGRQFAGFRMPVVTGTVPLHELITPLSRLKVMPSASVHFLASVALNIFKAAGAFHEAGIVIGDINAKNILVRPDGTIRLIDIDSVQIGDGRRFTCPVAVPEYCPPELQGRSFETTPRTKSSDVFSAAVLTYQLLCAGRHPYDSSIDGSLADAIKQNMSVFVASPQVSSALNTLRLTEAQLMTPSLIALLRTAFDADAKRRGRPTAANFVQALAGLLVEFAPCANNPRHFHLQGLSRCPWCASEQSGIPGLFGPTVFRPRPVAAPVRVVATAARAAPASYGSSSAAPQTLKQKVWRVIAHQVIPGLVDFTVAVFVPALWFLVSNVLYGKIAKPAFMALPWRMRMGLTAVTAGVALWIAVPPLVALSAASRRLEPKIATAIEPATAKAEVKLSAPEPRKPAIVAPVVPPPPAVVQKASPALSEVSVSAATPEDKPQEASSRKHAKPKYRQEPVPRTMPFEEIFRKRKGPERKHAPSEFQMRRTGTGPAKTYR